MRTHLLCVVTALLFLPFLVQAQTSTYTPADLPAGWTWDTTQIQGDILPAVYGLPANDPNMWLVPCGPLIRWGPTSDWVKEVRVVSAIGTSGVTAYVDHDPVTHKSTTWRLEVPAVPGPWYIVVDAVSQPGKNGQSKTKRYTVVGAGYVPDNELPFLN